MQYERIFINEGNGGGHWSTTVAKQDDIPVANDWLSAHPRTDMYTAAIYHLACLDIEAGQSEKPPKDYTDALRRLNQYGIGIFVARSRLTNAQFHFRKTNELIVKYDP